MEPPIIELRNVSKSYRVGDMSLPVLTGVSLKIEKGEFAAILGPSGSGKSTLLAILGCLDLPTSGDVLLRGRDVAGLSEDDLAKARNREIGFVFQNFHLLPYYDAISNVELPLLYGGAQNPRARASQLLERVGLKDRMAHLPNQLSGGQRQRVAIARALANHPSLLLADEPTGNLDSKSGEEVLALFRDLHRDGSTILIVTHDARVASLARRIVRVGDGAIVGDKRSFTGGAP